MPSTVSILNDVIGPVMRGASSSHCAAALRIGRLARDLMGGRVTRLLVEFDTNGSLPATHESQGSDMGLFGGLLGWDAADERLPRSRAALEAAGLRGLGGAGFPAGRKWRLVRAQPRRPVGDEEHVVHRLGHVAAGYGGAPGMGCDSDGRLVHHDVAAQAIHA